MNNGVSGCIDRFGADIYHVVDSEGGIAGSGHSAYIVGNAAAGYTTYDYQSESSSGGSSSSTSRIQGGFSTVQDATDYLNSNRTAEHNYDKGQSWSTTPSEDAWAQSSASSYMTEDYDLLDHNCYDLGPDAIIDAVNDLRNGQNTIDVSGGPSPNSAFDYNNTHGATTFVTE